MRQMVKLTNCTILQSKRRTLPVNRDILSSICFAFWIKSGLSQMQAALPLSYTEGVTPNNI